ncbi:hypothetical protein [Cryptosporangium aurantiacum]|uniref:Uncharacterized protein n=1 Tax=Cryptosporangium aurantiacum TaxID=134849 RepID=A0A1M7RJY6_9ACTN|nr:hypothetical protein [Cryptosporangium aurantiacum]SHN46469.1 hypothetical protein SAMN05443668_1165 [Cryptosporangium aurantiacum]
MKLFFLALVGALAIAVGVFGVVHGEADDSPGLQLIGALIVVATLVYGVRTVRRSR